MSLTILLIKVDLPIPFLPIKAIFSPLEIDKSTLEKICLSP